MHVQLVFQVTVLISFFLIRVLVLSRPFDHTSLGRDIELSLRSAYGSFSPFWEKLVFCLGTRFEALWSRDRQCHLLTCSPGCLSKSKILWWMDQSIRHVSEYFSTEQIQVDSFECLYRAEHDLPHGSTSLRESRSSLLKARKPRLA